ncbi:MAG: dihydroorotase, partial [Candidatus Muproteobacteria bacterium RBG_16_64_11]
MLILNAVIARPDGTTLEGDLACEHGLIARIDAAIDAAAAETIDAQGALLLPGVIDTHVHFREPGKEYKEDLASGSRAAASGGVTSFLEMPNTEPPTIDQASLDFKLARAAETCAVNYGFFIGATPTNLDAVNRVAPVAGIKVFMGCSTGGLLVDKDEDLERIFAGGERLIAVHAEDETRMHERRRLFADRRDSAVHSEIRDNLCALRATERALAFSKRHRRPLHILHLSTHEEIELLRRDKPAWVKAEVIPNHLFLNVKDYERLGTRAQMNPPIRAPEDNAALWQALQDGVIDFLGSDHAPHTLAEKQLEYPNSPSGMPGVETSLPLMLTHMTAGKCTLAELQRWMCSGPAEHYRIPNKGKLLEGWDADLTLVDIRTRKPVRNEELFTKAKWSPYEGWKLVGWPLYTVVGGQVA